MARQQEPDGHRIPVSIKLSDAEADLIDSARGRVSRAAWMRAAALAAANGDSGIPQQKRGSITPAPEPPAVAPRKAAARRAAPQAAAPAAGVAAQSAPAKAARECPPHPKARVNKNFCSQCKRGVLPGEKVA